MRRLNYSDILDTEVKTVIFTRAYLRGVNYNIPNILDILIQLIYFTDPKKSANTPEEEYQSFCWHQYLQAPYSFRACYILWELGYYLESTFILRSLVENFIKMRYLKRHKDLSTKVWVKESINVIKNSKKKKLTLRDMSEEIAPGFYDINYGHLFSGFQHGGTGASLFRIKRKSPTEGKIRIGSIYDEFGASFVINYFIALCYGFLNYFPTFFPSGFTKIEKGFLTQYNDSKLWLEKSMEGHRKTNPKSKNWYKEIDPLIK